ncbi:hypothetical protein MNBD_ALPHA09-982 [hydrothermal vent metagenome]|uniref:Uncharacterized protein n=1 Tax=hydrothermal vent metagenome TaxID=652676 RepID=A0A3B0U563_9ZZZZ
MNAAKAQPLLVEIGVGELIDKITILRIKTERMTDEGKLANVAHELIALEEVRGAKVPATPELGRLEAELKTVNEALWEIEDDIRACEAEADFGPEFVRLARAVYQTNDRRADLKKAINFAAGSTVIEEKSYFTVS